MRGVPVVRAGCWDTLHLRANLVEEDVLPVCALCGVLLQYPFVVDAMLRTELLPELHANCRDTQHVVSVLCTRH